MFSVAGRPGSGLGAAAGDYYGECNQICGINHSRMPIKVVAMPKPEFDKWLGEAKTKFAAAPSAGGQNTPAGPAANPSAPPPGSAQPAPAQH